MTQGTRDRIIVAARHLFLTHGFGHVGLDQIVQQAGLTKTTFYNHFESKEDLVSEVIDLHEQGMRDRLVEGAARIAGDDVRGRLLALFDVLAESDGQPREAACLMLCAAAQHPNRRDPINQAAVRNNTELERLIQDWAEEAGAPEPGRLATQFSILIYGVAVNGSLTRSMRDAAEQARDAASLLLVDAFD